MSQACVVRLEDLQERDHRGSRDKPLDDVAFNFLVGNNDAHGKNFSLLDLPESARRCSRPPMTC